MLLCGGFTVYGRTSACDVFLCYVVYTTSLTSDNNFRDAACDSSLYRYILNLHIIIKMQKSCCHHLCSIAFADSEAGKLLWKYRQYSTA
jgi:hypothetical protein